MITLSFAIFHWLCGAETYLVMMLFVAMCLDAGLTVFAIYAIARIKGVKF